MAASFPQIPVTVGLAYLSPPRGAGADVDADTTAGGSPRASPAAGSSGGDGGDSDADDSEEGLVLPAALVRNHPKAVVDLIEELAREIPGLKNALKADADAEFREPAILGGVPAEGTLGGTDPVNRQKVKVSPPVRGAHSELDPVTSLQWAQQCLTGGHYWSEPSEAATFLFSYQGVDWITWTWHTIMFSSIFKFFSCGTCPRFRRLGNAFVTWRPDVRKLRGTPPSDDELATLKLTFSIMALFSLPAIVLFANTEIVGGVSGFSLMPGPEWYGGISVSVACVVCLMGIYIFSILAGLTLWPQKLVGTRPASLPMFMSMLVRTTAPQYMISYSWGGEIEQGFLGLAHALAEVLSDCWIDVRRLTPGQRLLDEVRMPALHARVLIILMNPAYVNSTNCGHELLAAITGRRSGLHRTVVLIEATDRVVGFAPSWKRISVLLRRAGFEVVRSIAGADNSGPLNRQVQGADVDDNTASLRETQISDTSASFEESVGLLEWLDRRACRHDFKADPANRHDFDERVINEKDARTTMAWFATYADGIAEATASAQDLRLPCELIVRALPPPPHPPPTARLPQHPRSRIVTGNFYMKPGRVHRDEARVQSIQTVSLCKDFTKYLSGLCINRRPRLSVSTGHSGFWVPANLSEGPKPHVALTTTLLATAMIALFVPVGVIALIYLFLWNSNGLSGSDLLLYVLNEAGAAALLCLFTMAPLAVFVVRWGDVLTAPGSQLHSPELFVPLLVREVNLLLPEGSDLKLKVRFLVPPIENSSNCHRIANNLCALLECACFDAKVMPFGKTGIFDADSAFDANTVYVLMLERRQDAKAWMESQKRDPQHGVRRLRTEQVVLVASSRFLSAERKLYEWLVIEFAEAGMNYRLTPSGTPSGLSLASQILNAISMKLVGLLATRKHAAGGEAGEGDATATPRSGGAAASPLQSRSPGGADSLRGSGIDRD